MEKTTEYGKIKISDYAFEKLVKEAIARSEGRETLAVERKNTIISETDDDITIEFHVVHKFGTSLWYSSRVVLAHLEYLLKSLELGKRTVIKMKVVGVKARKTVKRDLEYVRVIK